MGTFSLIRSYLIHNKRMIIHAIRRFNLRRRGIVIGGNAVISKDCVFEGSNTIGRNSRIGANVILRYGASAGSNVYLSNIEVGENSEIESGVICSGDGKGRITIGKECYIGINNILDCSENITIGDFVHIAGPSTAVYTHSGAPMCMQGIPLKDAKPEVRPTGPVTIADNVYIGPNCTISPGITISHHSVISPNSLVTRDVPPHIMAGGVPARKLWEYQQGND